MNLCNQTLRSTHKFSLLVQSQYIICTRYETLNMYQTLHVHVVSRILLICAISTISLAEWSSYTLSHETCEVTGDHIHV